METIKFVSFIDWLEERFIGDGEHKGVPITKDNCEKQFDNWLSEMDNQEVIDYAEAYGKWIFIHGQSLHSGF